MARKIRPEGKIHWVQGREGGRDVLLHVSVPYGKTRREVRVPMEPEMIIAIADALRCCPKIADTVPVGSFGEGPNGGYRYEHQDLIHIGHAIWHYDNPTSVRPCLPHDGRVIDVADETKLTAGNAIDVESTEVTK